MIIFIEKTLFYGLLIFILALGLMSCTVPLRNIDTNGYYYHGSGVDRPVECKKISESLTKCKSR